MKTQHELDLIAVTHKLAKHNIWAQHFDTDEEAYSLFHKMADASLADTQDQFEQFVRRYHLYKAR